MKEKMKTKVEIILNTVALIISIVAIALQFLSETNYVIVGTMALIAVLQVVAIIIRLKEKKK